MSSYVTFIKASKKIASEFSEHEKQVLNGIAQRDSSALCRVQDILRMSSIASPATLHKTLSELVSRGYLSLQQSKEDGRIKYVTFTKKTEKLIDKLSAILKSSVS